MEIYLVNSVINLLNNWDQEVIDLQTVKLNCICETVIELVW